MATSVRRKPRRRVDWKWQQKELWYGQLLRQKEYTPPSPLASLERQLREAKRLSVLKELRTSPQDFFEDLKKIIEGLLKEMSQGKRRLYILSPFLNREYVNDFIDFIEQLRKKGLLDDVTVVTRHPKYFTGENRDHHEELIEAMREAGIRVCYGTDRFHAKLTVLDDKYVIAGSINPLAPSYSETIYQMSLEEYKELLIKNPRSAVAIIKNLVYPICYPNTHRSHPELAS